MSLGVSRISFGEATSNVNPQDILSRPGAFSRPVDAQNNVQPDNKPAKKSSGVGKKILYTIVGLAAIAGVLYSLPKFFPKVFDTAKDLDGLKGFDKYKSYVTTYTAKAGVWIGEQCTKAYEGIASLLHIKKP